MKSPNTTINTQDDNGWGKSIILSVKSSEKMSFKVRVER